MWFTYSNRIGIKTKIICIKSKKRKVYMAKQELKRSENA